MSCTEQPAAMAADERSLLLEIVHTAIRHGVSSGVRHRPDLAELPPSLRQAGACFVTLYWQGKLRGCVGSLGSSQPLAMTAARSAYNAAFEDPRFSPLQSQELDELSVHISVLSAPEPMGFDDEADLLSQLRPGVDGLILRDGPHSGTFLPSVWEQLPSPLLFLQQLKKKAGLPADHWSSSLQIERYTAEGFGDEETLSHP